MRKFYSLLKLTTVVAPVVPKLIEAMQSDSDSYSSAPVDIGPMRYTVEDGDIFLSARYHNPNDPLVTAISRPTRDNEGKIFRYDSDIAVIPPGKKYKVTEDFLKFGTSDSSKLCYYFNPWSNNTQIDFNQGVVLGVGALAAGVAWYVGILDVTNISVTYDAEQNRINISSINPLLNVTVSFDVDGNFQQVRFNVSQGGGTVFVNGYNTYSIPLPAAIDRKPYDPLKNLSLAIKFNNNNAYSEFMKGKEDRLVDVDDKYYDT